MKRLGWHSMSLSRRVLLLLTLVLLFITVRLVRLARRGGAPRQGAQRVAALARGVAPT